VSSKQIESKDYGLIIENRYWLILNLLQEVLSIGEYLYIELYNYLRVVDFLLFQNSSSNPKFTKE